MLLTVKVKLLPNSEQKQQLLATMGMYKRIREEYALSAQLAVRCISNVMESDKADFTNIRERSKLKARDAPKSQQEGIKVQGGREPPPQQGRGIYGQRHLTWNCVGGTDAYQRPVNG